MELITFTEVLVAGTIAVLIPVQSIECRSKRRQVLLPPCFARLYGALTHIQQGKVPDRVGWVEIVGEE